MVDRDMLYATIRELRFPPPIDDLEMGWKLHIEFEPGTSVRSLWRTTVYDHSSRERVMQMDYREDNELREIVLWACKDYADELNSIVQYANWLESQQK